MKRLIDQWDDRELQEIIRNLGGHDFSMLREAFSQVDVSDGPCVVFAYTLKGVDAAVHRRPAEPLCGPV